MTKKQFPVDNDILNENHITYGKASDTSIASNALSIAITAPAAGYRIFLGSIVLTGTTGGGGAEALTIKDGSTTVWTETFTVGTDKVRQFDAVPLVGTEATAMTISASATALTAGGLYVLYLVKP